MRARPAAGPSRIATATARFSSTTGDGSMRKQHVVKSDDLAPIRGIGACRVGVDCRDRRLQRVRAEAPGCDCSLDQRRPFGDLFSIPARTILVAQQNELTGWRDTRRTPGFLQKHHRQQPDRLGFRQQLNEQPSEANGLAGEVEPHQRLPGRSRVALVEHQVDHPQHDFKPLRQLVRCRAPGTEFARRESWIWRARYVARVWVRPSGMPARSPRW